MIAEGSGGGGGGVDDGGSCGTNPMRGEEDDDDEAEAWTRLLCSDAAFETEDGQPDAFSRSCGGEGASSASAGLGCSGMRPQDLIEWLRSRTEVRPSSSFPSPQHTH